MVMALDGTAQLTAETVTRIARLRIGDGIAIPADVEPVIDEGWAMTQDRATIIH